MTLELRPCAVCQSDPGFGTLHVGCARCERVKGDREKQPRLVVVSRSPLVYGEPPSGHGPPVIA